MITQDNITRHELVGLHAEVVSSSNRSAVGLQGTVIYETRSMLHLRTGERTVMLPKSHCTWRFVADGADVMVDGAAIKKRPHERLVAKR